jgi:hypothetical protein
VVDDEVDHDPDTAILRPLQQLDEIAEGSDAGVDSVVVGDVVAVVPVWCGVDRVKPDAGHAEPGQVIEPGDQTGDVADSVSIRILERLDVERIDDSVLKPALLQGVLPS